MLALACFCVNILCTNKYNMQVYMMMWYDLPYLQLQVALCVCCHVKLGATQSPFVASMKPLLLHIPQSKGGAALRQHLSRDALDAAEALGLWSCFGSAGVAESLGKATGEARTEQLEKKLSQLLRIIPAAGCLVLGALFCFFPRFVARSWTMDWDGVWKQQKPGLKHVSANKITPEASNNTFIRLSL